MTALEDNLISSLKHIAASCASRGEKEVFIGYPALGNYEFLADGARYRGSICADFVKALVAAIGFDGRQTIDASLWCGICSLGPHQIICLTWTATEAEPAKGSIAKSLCNSATILLVEDDPQFATVLTTLLKSQGLTCIVTRSAEQALPIAAEFSLIISDLHLPQMSGAELLRELKREA